MDNSFVFAINAVSPILITVLIGYVLKKIGLMSGELAKSVNKLVFRVFLPVMLFNNISGQHQYTSKNTATLYWSFVAVFSFTGQLQISVEKKDKEC